MAKPNEKLKPGYHGNVTYCDYTRGVPYPDEPFLVCGRCGAEWEDAKIQVKDEIDEDVWWI